MTEKGEERRLDRIEEKLHKNGDETIIDYGEYVRAVKEVLKKMQAGEDLEGILARAEYSQKLKALLRMEVPKLVDGLKKENLWEKNSEANFRVL